MFLRQKSFCLFKRCAFTMKTRYNGADMKQKRASRKGRRPTKAYSNYIYRLKKASPAVTNTVVVPGWLRAELCTRVGTEAARLAKFNRRGTITQREVCTAVRALRKVTRRTAAHAQ